MSQFQPALEYVLNFEDRGRTYAATPDPGGSAIAGVNSAAWLNSYQDIANAQQGQRAALVAAFYQAKFWISLQIGGINDQDVANRVLDMSVNGGPRWGPKILQMAANTLGCTLTVDGQLGPNTFEAVNALDPERLLAAYRMARVAHYQSIAAAKPELAKYLPVWTERAEA